MTPMTYTHIDDMPQPLDGFEAIAIVADEVMYETLCEDTMLMSDDEVARLASSQDVL